MKTIQTSQNSQRGFSIVEIIFVLVVFGLIIGVGLFVAGKMNNKDIRPGDNNGSQKASNNSGEPDLQIYNFGIEDLGNVEVVATATRDFTVNKRKGFYLFGDELPGTPVRYNPNFEFASLKEGTTLISAIDGVVGFVREQKESKDFEVFLMPQEPSRWLIGYDHVTDLKVKKGDKVKVGQELGKPARENSGNLRYEFQINKDNDSDDGTHICPSSLLASSVRQKVLNDLANMQNSWESITGLELYNLADQNPVGCLKSEMTPKYASGQ